jgi:F0F1-type ATP synthase membrane subunit c/vacuolar-type H+-ATPase subunit K
MADPLTMALIMGGGAAVKGIGQGIAAYQGAGS